MERAIWIGCQWSRVAAWSPSTMIERWRIRAMLCAYTVPLMLAIPIGAPAAPTYSDILPLAKVRAGMKGYGLTVFHGTRIERFDVTIVAVVKNGSLVAPGHDMILVRMSGGPITGRRANLIRGMSGSPVYVGGKCIGAFSQGEPGAKEPLGGVTPIEDMLEAWDSKLPEKPEGASLWPEAPRAGRLTALRRPLKVGDRIIRRIHFDAPEGAVSRPADTLVLRPCSGMITVSGLSGNARRRLAEMLEPYGVDVSQAAAGRRNASFRGASLQPGAAFSVMLLAGDITSGATGTVTYRRGARILGFGHSMLGVGPIRAPLCAAYVHDVYPLNAGSYKITTPGPVLGTLLQDRPFGVSGLAGGEPDTVPITVTVEDHTIGRTKTYQMQAVWHPRLTAGLLSLAAGSAVADIHTNSDPVTARVETALEAADLGRVARSNVVYSAGLIDTAVTGDLDQMLQILTANPFRCIPPRRVSVRVSIEPGRQTATIEQISVPDERYRPGDTVPVTVVVKPYGRAAETRTLSLHLPANCASGQLTLTVQGGAPPPSTSFGGIVFRPAPSPQPERAPPSNPEQMMRQFLRREAGNEIAAVLSLPTSSVAVEGEPLRGLPPVLDAVMRSKRLSSVRTDRDEVRVTLPTEWVVSGRQTLTITVQKRIFSSQPAGSAGTSSGSSSGLQRQGQPSTPVMISDFAMSNQGGARPGLRGDSGQQGRSGASRSVQQKAEPQAGQESAAPSQADPSEKPVAKAARVWRQSVVQDWADADKEGVSACSDNVLRLCPRFEGVCSVPESFVWCLLPNEDGSVYAGTGTSARVYHILSDGTCKQVGSLPEVSVHCLARLPDGSLLAGTGSSGRTYRIPPTGSPTVFHTASEPYVLALAVASDGTVYVGTGGGAGSLYRIARSGAAERLATGIDEHVQALCLCGSDLFIGTSGRGLLLRYPPDGKPQVLLESSGQSFTSLAAMSDGSVLAATAPSSRLYRVQGDRGAEVLLEPPGTGLLSVAPLADGGFAVAGRSGAFLGTTSGIQRPLDVPPTTEPLSICVAGRGDLWLGTANSGSVYHARLVTAGSTGSVCSPVLDAGTTARWGRLTLAARLPAGSGCEVRTRSGDTAEPDATWSLWRTLRSDATGGEILSPPARYLQYRLELVASPAGETPEIQSITVSYLPNNRAPAVSLEQPSGGEHWSGRQTIKWQASDPDQDALDYTVEYSPDRGSTWLPVPDAALGTPAGAVTRGPQTKSEGKTPPSGAIIRSPVTVADVTAELDRHPDIPPALRQEILERTRKLEQERQQQPAAADTKPSKPLRENQRTLDTTRLPDGAFLFRIRASDAPANWTDARSAVSLPREVLICNSAPVLYILNGTRQLRPDRTFVVECVAVQRVAYVSAAQWRVDGGDWTAAAPVDGVADGSLERFLVTAGPLAPGKHRLEVRVFSSAGPSAAEVLDIDIAGEDGKP